MAHCRSSTVQRFNKHIVGSKITWAMWISWEIHNRVGNGLRDTRWDCHSSRHGKYIYGPSRRQQSTSRWTLALMPGVPALVHVQAPACLLHRNQDEYLATPYVQHSISHTAGRLHEKQFIINDHVPRDAVVLCELQVRHGGLERVPLRHPPGTGWRWAQETSEHGPLDNHQHRHCMFLPAVLQTSVAHLMGPLPRAGRRLVNQQNLHRGISMWNVCFQTKIAHICKVHAISIRTGTFVTGTLFEIFFIGMLISCKKDFILLFLCLGSTCEWKTLWTQLLSILVLSFWIRRPALSIWFIWWHNKWCGPVAFYSLILFVFDSGWFEQVPNIPKQIPAGMHRKSMSVGFWNKLWVERSFCCVFILKNVWGLRWTKNFSKKFGTKNSKGRL